MVILAVPDFAPETAVTTTVAGTGGVTGAVNLPVPLIVPQAPPLHPGPETFQVTTALGEPITWALNCSCVPAVTSALPGNTDTVPRTATVTVATADFVGSACEVAFTVTVGGVGIAAGAV